jgi:hypothetical protein
MYITGNIHTLQAFSMYTNMDYNVYYTWRIPLALSPLANSLLPPPLFPFVLTWTLLAVTGSVHLGLRLLVN